MNHVLFHSLLHPGKKIRRKIVLRPLCIYIYIYTRCIRLLFSRTITTWRLNEMSRLTTTEYEPLHKNWVKRILVEKEKEIF
jgi:hypothetical protein